MSIDFILLYIWAGGFILWMVFVFVITINKTTESWYKEHENTLKVIPIMWILIWMIGAGVYLLISSLIEG